MLSVNLPSPVFLKILDEFEHDLDVLKDRCGDIVSKLAVVPNPCSPNALRDSIENLQNYLIFVGNKITNIEYLVNSSVKTKFLKFMSRYQTISEDFFELVDSHSMIS
ncbi:hypothetical protein GEMRC1_006930 [Eukaryota sp. GEM-RC1]